MVTVEGSGFGASGRLAVDRLSIPADAIRRWTGQLIIFSVPDTMQSGLLRVYTPTGSSNPHFVTVSTDLPRHRRDRMVRIDGIEPPSAAVGDPVTITGAGFGPRTAMARLELRRDGDGGVTGITAVRPEVLAWSDRSIELVVPSGVPAGIHRVSVNGTAVDAALTVEPPLATVTYGSPQRYAVRMSLAVAGVTDEVVATLPTVPVTGTQPEVQVLRAAPDPVEVIAGRAALYRFAPVEVPADNETPAAEADAAPADPVQRAERVVLVVRRAARWDLTGDTSSQRLLTDWFQAAFRPYLAPAPGVPINDPAVDRLRRSIDLAQPVVALARAIHRLVIRSLEPAIGGEHDPVVVLAADGDQPPGASSFAYANLAVALARGAGLPARRQFGLILDDGGESLPHAWVEFFLPEIGWVPADPAIGDRYLGERGASLAAFYGDASVEGTFGAIDDRRVVVATDDRPLPRMYPFGGHRVPDDSWAPAVIRAESPAERFPSETRLEWAVPTLLAWLE